MKHALLLIAVAAGTLAAEPAFAQDAGRGGRTGAQAQPVTLAQARALFQRVDADRDGLLSVREADHGGIDAAGHGTFDADGDGALSADEFLVGYALVQSRQGRGIAPDLEAESTRLQALRRAKERVREVPTPPAGSTPPATSGRDGAGERGAGERGVGERGAQVRERGQDEVPPSPPGLDERAEVARENLERRIDGTGAGGSAAEAARDRLDQRIDRALSGGEPPGPAEQTRRPVDPSVARRVAAEAARARAAGAGEDRVSEGAAEPTLEERARAAQEALNRRLRTTGASEELSAQAREGLRQRVSNAGRDRTPEPGSEGVSGAAEVPSPGGSGSDEPPPTLEERARAAQEALNRRLGTTRASEETSAAARESLRRRVGNAARAGEPRPGEDAGQAERSRQEATPQPTLEERARAAQEALDRRLRRTGAGEDTGAAAREGLRRRAGNAQRVGSDAERARSSGDGPPAPPPPPRVRREVPPSPAPETPPPPRPREGAGRSGDGA